MTAAYRVIAYNSAQESENKIHDDAVARRFGFTGGLVPGVDVWAYMAHPALTRWGRDWLERGSGQCRFVRPVYDGDEAVVEAAETPEGLAIAVRSHGEACAEGTAGLPAVAPEPGAFAAPPPPPEQRPPADETSLAVGTLLGMRPLLLTEAVQQAYLRDVRETDPLCGQAGLAHPGMILRTGNWALSHNVVLGPWMHVGSTLRNLSAVRVGETITAPARVADNYERKGHRFVELDVLTLAEGTRPVALIRHVAIYRPRQAG